MPYLNQARLNRLYAKLGLLETSEDLNFLITESIKEYLESNRESYQAYNDCLGALEGAKLELYRRKIAPYEDKKIEENGDVY